MGSISTEAWVLPSATRQPERGELVNATFTFPDISASEVLARPLYGCLEGNMLHAIERDPIDICRERKEDSVVIGNAGVVRVERVGAKVEGIAEGDTCLVFGNGVWDEQGYPVKILGYDAPGTMGVLAKRMKLHHRQLIRIPDGTAFTLPQWAAFSLRYISAWANWHVAYCCWRSQMADVPPSETIVCGWGGGVSFAQLSLAQRAGCRVIMIGSHPQRIELLKRSGIDAIDRSQFRDEEFEQGILAKIAEKTDGQGVSIFIDNLGTPVHRITLKALARQGVMTTCGWKLGMRTPVARAIECLHRHIHVHTHYARYEEGLDAVRYAEEHGWIPQPEQRIWRWEEIPSLFEQYARGSVASYFPIFAINA